MFIRIIIAAHTPMKIKTKESNKSSGFTIIAALFIIMVIVLIGLVGWYMYRQHHKTNLVTRSTTSTTTKSSGSSSSSSNTSNSNKAPVSKTPTVTPNCSSSNLALSLGPLQGAAGTSYMNVVLKNTASNSCVISGYPTVALSDGSGSALGNPASQSGSSTPSSITLTANQSVNASVGFPNPGFFDPSQCSQASTYIKVTPPNNQTALQASLSEQNCPGFSVGALQAGNGY